MKISKDIRTRLYYEWKYSPVPNGDTMLIEKHGMPNKVDEVMDIISPTIEKYIIRYNTELPDTFSKGLTFDVNSDFVDETSIILYFEKTGCSKTYGGATYSKPHSVFDNTNGKFNLITVECKMYVNGDGIKVNDVLPLIAHELVHAYEDYNRRNNRVDDVLLQQ